MVLERLEEGNALENVDEFLTQLAANGEVPDFQPVVRDRLMNSTFNIISPHFPHFTRTDWLLWFHVKLVPILPSFSPTMLQNATSRLNCTNYHVCEWIGQSVPCDVDAYTTRNRSRYGGLPEKFYQCHQPDRQGNQSDSEWLGANFGPFSQYTTYSELKVFNLSVLAVSDALSPDQKAELILDPDRDASEDEAVVREVFNSLTELQSRQQLDAFFQAFAKINKQRNITFLQNPIVRDTILNRTLTALAPGFQDFEPEDFRLWFQDYLATLMPSLGPGSLVGIPRNITCASYSAILSGLRQSLTSLPLALSQGVRSGIESLRETFTRCSVPDSFMCKRTPVNEDLICAAVDR
ncbi:uncharacterized protein AB9X84_021668 [Acanthopagrus schlegelii]